MTRGISHSWRDVPAVVGVAIVSVLILIAHGLSWPFRRSKP